MADRFMSAPTIHPAIPMSACIREPELPKGLLPTGNSGRNGFGTPIFDEIWKQGILSKAEAYRWVADKFCLTEKQAHIGQFSNYMCDQLIQASADVLKTTIFPAASGRPVERR